MLPPAIPDTRRRLCAWYLLVLLSGPLPCVAQQWIPTNGPLGGEVTSVTVTDGGLIVCGTLNKGVFYKEVSEPDWTRSTATVFDDANILAITPHEGRLFAASAEIGIWVSADGGEHWTSINDGLGTPIIHALKSASDGRLFAGAADGLYVLTSPDSWVHVQGGSEGYDVRAIAENSAGTLFAGTYGSGVLRSRDGGVSWDELQNGLTVNIVRSLAIDDEDRIYAGTFGGDVVERSDNDGDTWLASSDGLDAQGVWSVAIAPDGTFFAGTRREGIFSSTDGRVWQHLDAAITAVSGFAFVGDGVLAATRVGLLVSDTIGESWSLEGIPSSRVNTLLESGSRVLAGIQLGGVHYSDDGGVSWHPSSLNNEDVLKIVDDGEGRLLAGSLLSGLYASDDNGAGWLQIWKTARVVYSVGVDAAGMIVGGTDSGVYRFSEADSTWRLISPSGVTIWSLLQTSSGALFAGTADDGIWRLSEPDAEWIPVADALRDRGLHIRDLLELPDGRIAAGTNGIGVWLSEDGGDTWQLLPGTDHLAVTDLTLSHHGELVIVGLFGEVYRAHQDSGQAVQVGPELPAAFVRTVAVLKDGTVLIGADPFGVQVLDGLHIDAFEPEPSFVTPIDLNVFPNPASRHATIEVEIAHPSPVRWVIVDVLGRTLLRGESESPVYGSLTMRLDTSALAPGPYWIRLLSGDGVLVRNLVVVR